MININTNEENRFIYDGGSGYLFFDRGSIRENEQITIAKLKTDLYSNKG